MNRMMILVLFLAISLLVTYTQAHGKLMKPINRGSVWKCPYQKANFSRPVTAFDTEWCSFNDLDDPRNKRNVTCGICGPVYNNDPTAVLELKRNGIKTRLYSFEKGSVIYSGEIVANYTQGQLLESKVQIVVRDNHGGLVQFRICNLDGMTDEPGMECFDNNILTFESGETELELSRGFRRRVYHNFKVWLPVDLTCKHCIFQWRWFNTTLDQIHIGCADISISK